MDDVIPRSPGSKPVPRSPQFMARLGGITLDRSMASPPSKKLVSNFPPPLVAEPRSLDSERDRRCEKNGVQSVTCLKFANLQKRCTDFYRAGWIASDGNQSITRRPKACGLMKIPYPIIYLGNYVLIVGINTYLVFRSVYQYHHSKSMHCTPHSHRSAHNVSASPSPPSAALAQVGGRSVLSIISMEKLTVTGGVMVEAEQVRLARVTAGHLGGAAVHRSFPRIPPAPRRAAPPAAT